MTTTSLPRPVEVATGHEPFLVMRDLVKRYPGVLALDHFGGAIRAGVVLGLLGKNGAGKSTVIKVLAGALKSTVFVYRGEGALPTDSTA